MVKWWKANPGKGKHGVDDKGAHRVGRQWDKDREEKDDKKVEKDE